MRPRPVELVGVLRPRPLNETREVCHRSRRGPILVPVPVIPLRQTIARKWVDEAAVYYDRLRPYASDVDIWEVTYQQVLSGDDAVLEWVKGSALRPVLTELEPEMAKQYLVEYGAALRDAYPRREDGTTLYPFARLFMVAKRA